MVLIMKNQRRSVYEYLMLEGVLVVKKDAYLPKHQHITEVPNLVVMMLKGSGFEVDDLGVDCRIETFEKAVADGAQVLCLSALLSTTRDEMRPVVEHFKDRDDVKIVIGGAVITQEFADEIGADAYGVDASDAVRAVRESIGLEAAAG